MKVTLFDFQETALAQLRDRLAEARGFASSENPRAIAFSAPTGSGKTVIMTALFEQIFAGEAEFEAQSNAVILWVSDMPELNEQTRMKIEGQSDRIRVRQLVSIDSSFDREQLENGHIYFINTQKLGTDKLLTKVGDNRKFSIWDTLTNTARTIPDRFYVVIDEAHRGMLGAKAATQARTLMQRFILGHDADRLIRMPMVIGVSATPKRFLDLLKNAEDHTLYRVTVPTEEVRRSGLLKERILINHAKSPSKAEMSLLEEAAKRWMEMEKKWAEYCKAEQEKTVYPILVVQVENGNEKVLTRTDLAGTLDSIEGVIGRKLLDGQIAHTFNDSGSIDVGGRLVRKVEASRIEENKEINVVLFKTSLSTGWDCPRAEIMMSFRAAQDHTYIAQLLGRMVRTPLARRIERNTALNDVHLFLPHFDEKTVDDIVKDLKNVEDVPPAETGSAAELVTLKRRDGTKNIFSGMDDLITYRVNATRKQSSLRRYMGLARGLTMDEIVEPAWEEAKGLIIKEMGSRLKALKKAGDFSDIYESITTVGVRTTAVQQGGEIVKSIGEYSIDASAVDVDRLFEEAGRKLSNGIHMLYWQDNADRDAYDVKVEVVALAGLHTVMELLESTADKKFNQLYDANKRAIGKLREQRRMHYEKLRLATAKPQDVPWRLPDTIDFKRPAEAKIYDRHLYVEEDGIFRADLGGWEDSLIDEELGDESVVGWLRNVDRKQWSLEIPYESGGDVRPMFPDMIVVRNVSGELLFDILEPHDPGRSDNFEKAVGLAKFAELYGHLFGRVELIRKESSPAGGEHFVRLNLNTEATRKRVVLITSNPQLDEVFSSDAS